MNTLLLFVIGIFGVACVFFSIRLFRKANFIAMGLLMPYIITAITGFGIVINSTQNLKRKVILNPEMRNLGKLSSQEAISIVMSSGIIFGDGFYNSGGIVRSNIDFPLNQFLNERKVERPEKMAMIWLMDSRASNLIVDGRLLYVSDQRRADPGLWIGWVNEKDIKGIEQMDGVISD